MKYLKLTLVLLVLLGLPAVSWFYLKSGFQYQKKNVESLGDEGPVGSFMLRVEKGNILEPSSLSGSVWVASFISNHTAPALIDRYDKLYRQFGNSGYFRMFLVMTTPDKLPIQKLDSVRSVLANSLDTVSILHTPMISIDEVPAFATSVFQLPDTIDFMASLTLVDTSGTIRNIYNWAEDLEIKQLVENTILLIPRSERTVGFKKSGESS